jgi:hypothetical protein
MNGQLLKLQSVLVFCQESDMLVGQKLSFWGRERRWNMQSRRIAASPFERGFSHTISAMLVLAKVQEEYLGDGQELEGRRNDEHDNLDWW